MKFLDRIKECNILVLVVLSTFLIDAVSLILFHEPYFEKLIKIWLVGRYYERGMTIVFGPYVSAAVDIFIFIIICLLLTRKESKAHQIPIPSLNIDLIDKDDKEWIEEIKRDYKNKKKMIAYSKKGAKEARMRAIRLGIRKCFIDFKSFEEIEESRSLKTI